MKISFTASIIIITYTHNRWIYLSARFCMKKCYIQGQGCIEVCIFWDLGRGKPNFGQNSRTLAKSFNFKVVKVLSSPTAPSPLFLDAPLSRTTNFNTYTFYPQNGNDDDKGVYSIYRPLLWNKPTWNGKKLLWNENFRNFAVKPYSMMIAMIAIMADDDDG